MPMQPHFPCTFPTAFNVLNPPYLADFALKHTTLHQTQFDDVSNAICCCLNIFMCGLGGGGCVTMTIQ